MAKDKAETALVPSSDTLPPLMVGLVDAYKQRYREEVGAGRRYSLPRFVEEVGDGLFVALRTLGVSEDSNYPTVKVG